jgi:VWFA-related protein
MTSIHSPSAAPTPPGRLSVALSILLLAAAGLGGAALAAQEPPAEEPAAAEAVPLPADAVYESPAAADDLEVFVDTVDVQVVNVDVYVTDKKGNRVTGLAKDDFLLFEDRRPVEITNFYAVESGHPAAGETTDGDEPEVVPGAPPPLPLAYRQEAAEVPSDQRLFLVVYVDNFNIRPANRNRVLDDLGYFLSTEVAAGDQVMLVSYDRSLKIRRPFTADPELAARALEELERLTGHAVTRDDERRQALERIGESQGESQALAYARMHAESVQNDLKFTVGALKELIHQLGGLPGRKAILYVSDGVPMVPGQDVFYAVNGKFGSSLGITDSFQYDASRDFDELANAANANRVTFYTIDAAGLRLASTFAAENANPSLGIQVDSTFNNNHQSPLRFMAESTGGVAVVNTNRILPRLATVAEDFDTYYSLGYSPARAGTGRYHDIRVEVKGRKDLVVRHRKGYRDKTVEAQMNDGTLSALRFGFRDNPLGVRISFGEAQRKDGRFYVLPVQVEVPIGELVLVPREGSHEARLRLYVAALDEQGDTSPVQQVAVPISVPPAEVERARGQWYRYSVNLLMRSGLHQVSVGVRDEIGARESFVVETVQVGMRPDGRRKG